MPRVLILGASRFNVPVIRAVREAGFYAIVMDGNAEAPALREADLPVTGDIRADDAVRMVARVKKADGIVTLGEAGVRPVAAACAELRLPSISMEAALNATSKIRMRRCWDAIPQYSARWVLVRDEREAFAAPDAVGGFPVIVKPDRTHGGSRGVMRADNHDQLAEAYAFARTSGFSMEVIIEKFIESLSEHSAEVLIHEGKVSVLCSGEKVKTRGAYRVDLSVRYPSRFSPEQEARVADMCASAVKAIGLERGAAHIEFAWTARGPLLLELGARSGGGHTPLLARHVSGVDEIAEICRLACGIAPETFRPTARRGADYRFLAFPPGVLQEAIVPAEVREHAGVLDADVFVAPGGELRSVRTGADRAGFIAAVGEDRDDAVRVADWAMRRIAVRYADGEVKPALPIEEAGESH